MSPARRFSMTQAVMLMVALTVAACSADSNRPIPDNDLPAITSLDPTNAAENQGAFDLLVHGQGFSMDSVVRWSGSDRITTIQNPSAGVFILRASITAADVVNPTTAQITVFNPPPGGGVSNTVNFVVYPVPTISSVSPSTVTFDQDVTITVHGTGFVSGSTVIWKPAATTTAYTETPTSVNSTELTVMIQGAHVSPRGSGTLKVVNPGGGTSNPETLDVL